MMVSSICYACSCKSRPVPLLYSLWCSSCQHQVENLCFLASFMELFGQLGVPCEAVARLIEKRSYILGVGLNERVKPNVKFL